jgi:hypothetical protein
MVGFEVAVHGDSDGGEACPGQQVGAFPDPRLGIENVCTKDVTVSVSVIHISGNHAQVN